MAILNEGSKVKVREDLSANMFYQGERKLDGEFATDDMCLYRGREVTIDKVFDGIPEREIYYQVAEDKFKQSWSIGMFELKDK